MHARLLATLNVNDQDRLDPKAYAEFTVVTNLRSIGDVQKRRQSTHAETDLLLVDVDMSRAKMLADLEWGSADFRLYGPLLALPFLGGPSIKAFEPYSNFWGNEEVSSNGFVLVALSFILANVEQRPFTISDVRDHIQKSSEDEQQFVKEGEHALRQALEQYRGRLERDADFIDVDVTLQRLSDLQDAADAIEGGWPLNLPLEDAQGLLSIDFVDRQHRVDRVQVASLFGDLLGFQRPNKEDLHPVVQEMKRWRESSVPQMGETLYISVLKTLSDCESGVKLKSSAKASAFCSHRGSLYQVMRLAMLFAWVNAWRTAPDKKIETVHAMLGMRNVTTGRMDRSASTKYTRLLAVKGGSYRAGGPPWRGPFRSEYESVAEAYKLDADLPGVLTKFEKAMCQKYAVEELEWDAILDPSETPYPAWMV